MVKREMIRIGFLMLFGTCLALFLFVSNHNPLTFLLIACVPCMVYGGHALIRWGSNLFKWFLQMQFMSVVHRSLWGVVMAAMILIIGSLLVMGGSLFIGIYRIIRNILEDIEMDQILAINGLDSGKTNLKTCKRLNENRNEFHRLTDDLYHGTNADVT